MIQVLFHNNIIYIYIYIIIIILLLINLKRKDGKCMFYTAQIGTL